jgi:glycerate kinase
MKIIVATDSFKGCRSADKACGIIAGDVQLSRKEYEDFGVHAVFCLKKAGMTTEYAMANAGILLKESVFEFINDRI